MCVIHPNQRKNFVFKKFDPGATPVLEETLILF